MQEYKHLVYQHKRKTGKQPLLLLILLILIMMGTAAYRYLNGQSPTASTDTEIEIPITSNKPQLPPIVKQFNQLTSKQKTDHLFDNTKKLAFYDILALDEVIITDKVMEDATARGGVFVQLGAFTHSAAADNFQLQMKLHNIETNIESLLLPERGGEWFIVRLGPFKSDEELQTLVNQLQEKDIPYVLITKKPT